MEMLQLNKDMVQVQVTRNIIAGQILKINPSEAYLGIESGNIQVLAIISGTKSIDSEESTAGIDNKDIISYVSNHIEVECQLSGHYTDEVREMENKPWILYRYLRSDEEWACIPLEMFVAHTMQY